MNWDDLRFFLAVARVGSLARASRALSVSAPTVGRRVAALEEAVGAALFARHRDGYELTRSGEQLLESAEQVEAQMGALLRGASRLDHNVEGRVRVATFEVFGHDVIPEILLKLRRTHPKIAVDLVIAAQTTGLTRREADLAVRMGKPRAPGLIARKIGNVGFAMYRARGRRVRSRGLGDWTDGEIIGWDESLAELANAQWLRRRVRSRVPAIRATTMQAQIAACTAGLGAALLPCLIADRVRGLERIEGPTAETTRELWLVQLPELRRNARVQIVAEHIATVVASRHQALAGRSIGHGLQ